MKFLPNLGEFGSRMKELQAKSKLWVETPTPPVLIGLTKIKNVDFAICAFPLLNIKLGIFLARLLCPYA